MHLISRIFLVGYLLIVALFFTCGIGLIVLSALEAWNALNPGIDAPVRARFEILLECIGLLTIAVASLELGQTVLEEEIQRSANISSPTRVRRFLSRFLIVVVVSLSVETLIGVFQFVHGKPEYLPHAASVGLAAAAILATWGLFVRMNTEAEKLEPEAMAEVKAEDDEVEGEDSGDKPETEPVHANEIPPHHAPGQPHPGHPPERKE
ncbi:hypothetical protein ABIB42_005115 [Massilia sp. UYP32]|jgi:hypothetical protein|uniref:Uncharacterized protein n=1 Tax=Massilia timonae CCUG 45783 TaxID=883126 RepID=K9DFQ3_9BURK|nr:MULTISPECIES: hypothetical protein [Massilia]EKU83053.1 hypothetical protein HMPREF9710_01782 [Massilia timonae CCUG 45783]QYF99465.1 hypothetical protein KY496_13525 [Massilia sp. NP310]